MHSPFPCVFADFYPELSSQASVQERSFLSPSFPFLQSFPFSFSVEVPSRMLPLPFWYRILRVLRVLFSCPPSSFSSVRLLPLLFVFLWFLCPCDAPLASGIPAGALPSSCIPFLPPRHLESLVVPTSLDTRTPALPRACVYRVPAVVRPWVWPRKCAFRRLLHASSSHPFCPFASSG